MCRLCNGCSLRAALKKKKKKKSKVQTKFSGGPPTDLRSVLMQGAIIRGKEGLRWSRQIEWPQTTCSLEPWWKFQCRLHEFMRCVWSPDKNLIMNLSSVMRQPQEQLTGSSEMLWISPFLQARPQIRYFNGLAQIPMAYCISLVLPCCLDPWRRLVSRSHYNKIIGDTLECDACTYIVLSG